LKQNQGLIISFVIVFIFYYYLNTALCCSDGSLTSSSVYLIEIGHKSNNTISSDFFSF